MAEDIKKKLLFVINTLGSAGAEKALIELLNRPELKKYEVDLYVLLNQGELIRDIPEYVTVLNENYDTTPIHGDAGKKRLISFSLKALFKRGNIIVLLPYLIIETLKMLFAKRVQADKLLWQVTARAGKRIDKEYDLAIAYNEGGSTYYVSRYVKAKRKAAFVHIAYINAGYSRALDKNCYANIDRIFSVSDEVKEEFMKVYPETFDKSCVFHNIINPDAIRQKAKMEKAFEDDFNGYRIVTVGRLTKQKAYEYSVEALKILKDQGVNARWYALGEGDERSFIEKLAEDSGLKDDFLLLGNKANPYPYVSEADIYVHASRFEGKSIAIQEAQVLGKAIVATDCNGNREQIIDGEDGYLCKLEAKEIASAIKKLLEDQELASKMGSKAQEKIDRICAENEDLKKLLEMLN